MGNELNQFNEFWNKIVDEVGKNETTKGTVGRAHPVVFGRWEVWLGDGGETLHYRTVDEALENEHEVSKDQFMVQFITELQRKDDRNQWLGLYRQFHDQLE